MFKTAKYNSKRYTHYVFIQWWPFLLNTFETQQKTCITLVNTHPRLY